MGSGGGPHVVPDWSKISATARKLAKEKVPLSEYGCARHIRKVAEQLVQVEMSNQFVNCDPIEWSEYREKFRDSIIADAGTHDLEDVFHRIQERAAKWSGTVLHPIHRRVRRAS